MYRRGAVVTRRRGLLGAIIAGLGAGFLPTRSVQASARISEQAGQQMEGAWIVDTQTAAGRRLVALFTFNRDGTLSHTSQDHPIRGPSHGVWVRAGDREFDYTLTHLMFD